MCEYSVVQSIDEMFFGRKVVDISILLCVMSYRNIPVPVSTPLPIYLLSGSLQEKETEIDMRKERRGEMHRCTDARKYLQLFSQQRARNFLQSLSC